MQADILNITEPTTVDEAIEKYEFHEYEPVSRTNLNSAGEIRITIETQDLYCHPAESYLLIEGRFVKADGTAYADANAAAIVNNGLMYLFSQIGYRLSSQDIETIYHPGQATTMLGLLKYPDDFAKAQGLNQLWCKDTTATAVMPGNLGFAARQAYLIQKPTAKGTFSFVVPLRHIFGFCEDYNKIVYGVKHTLTLVRKADDDAIFRAGVIPAVGGNAQVAAVDAGKVDISKISWFMPHVTPSDMERMQLQKTIESKASLPVAYRARQCDTITVPQSTTFTWRLSVKSAPEKPRWIVVGFQTGRSGNQEHNPSIFDHCNLKNMYVMMNQERYPAVDYDLSFPNQKFSRAYRAAATFSEQYFGMNELITHGNITPVDYKDLYPLMVFDVSKQSEKLKASVVDVQIKAIFNAAVPAETQAYAVVISDKLLNLKSDGSKMSIVYS
jgi:hypothetical protein